VRSAFEDLAKAVWALGGSRGGCRNGGSGSAASKNVRFKECAVASRAKLDVLRKEHVRTSTGDAFAAFLRTLTNAQIAEFRARLERGETPETVLKDLHPMNAMTPIDQVKHWQDQITALEAKIEAQRDRIAEAQKAASGEAALNDTDTDTAVRRFSISATCWTRCSGAGVRHGDTCAMQEAVAQKRDDARIARPVHRPQAADAADELMNSWAD
jgi:hypothetical protein